MTEAVADRDVITAWLSSRFPDEWTAAGAPVVTTDREEVVVVLTTATPAPQFREDTRAQRMSIAAEAQREFGRTVSWGVQVDGGAHVELWTHLSTPAMTRLRQAERIVLDTLVDAGVARSRSDALAWCVRYVGKHQAEWLGELREATTAVDTVRRRGPTT